MALSLTSCGGAPEASGSGQPSATQPPVSEKDVCREWNELALSVEGSSLRGEERRAEYRDQILAVAAKAEGSLKTAMKVVADTPQPADQQVDQNIYDAGRVINDACGTAEFVASAAPSPEPTPAPATTAATADPGAVSKTTVLNAEIKGGYRANVTLVWHELKSLAQADFAAHPNCLNSPPKFESGWDNRQAIQGFVVTVTADFPPTNGFEWPQNKNVVAQTSSPFLLSCATTGTTVPNDSNAYLISPANPTVSYLIYQVANKTPDNPAGTFRAVTDIDNATVHLTGDSLVCVDDSAGPNKCKDTYR